MTPENLLRSMCERHGLPADYGQRLLPLVRRAMEAPDEVRDRILALVDGNLANRSESSEADVEEEFAKNEQLEAAREADTDILIAVARVLHDWSPSEPTFDLGPNLGGCGSQGTESI